MLFFFYFRDLFLARIQIAETSEERKHLRGRRAEGAREAKGRVMERTRDKNGRGTERTVYSKISKGSERMGVQEEEDRKNRMICER